MHGPDALLLRISHLSLFRHYSPQKIIHRVFLNALSLPSHNNTHSYHIIQSTHCVSFPSLTSWQQHHHTTMDEQEEQQEQEEEQQQESSTTAETRRMLHDAAYGSEGESARRIQRPSRPSVGSKSSLDFKIKNSGTDGVQGHTKEKPVTTKPTKRKKQPQPVMYEEQQEQQQHERVEQKYSRPMLQSRARGSGGPPPRKYTLDDLDRMNDEQIYRLLAEDPELHAAAMKAAAEKSTSRTSRRGSGTPRTKRSTSAPTGSKNSRKTPPKRIQEVPVEKEVPYFQWIILLALVGMGLYQAYKSHSRSASAKKTRSAPSSSTAGGKVKGGKQKKIKLKKATDATPREKFDDALVAKGLLEPDLVTDTPADGKAVKSKVNGTGGNGDSKKLLNKKKKKSNPPSIATAGTKEGAALHKVPDVTPKDKPLLSAKNNEKSSAPSMDARDSSQENNDDAWQTVAKSKAGSSITKGSETVNVKKDESDMAASGGSDTVKTNGQKVVTSNPSTGGGETTPQPIDNEFANESATKLELINNNSTTHLEKKTTTSKKNKKNKQKPVTPSSVDVPGSASTVDDEALALQLQQQEESLARAQTTNGNDVGDSAWEEVATRKKKT
jgi:hypothetical protein